jgi:hypothetical protein
MMVWTYLVYVAMSIAATVLVRFRGSRLFGDFAPEVATA